MPKYSPLGWGNQGSEKFEAYGHGASAGTRQKESMMLISSVSPFYPVQDLNPHKGAVHNYSELYSYLSLPSLDNRSKA